MFIVLFEQLDKNRIYTSLGNMNDTHQNAVNILGQPGLNLQERTKNFDIFRMTKSAKI